EGSDRGDTGSHVAGPGRPPGPRRSPCDRRQRDMARLPGEGAEPAMGAAPQAHPHQGFAETSDRLREVLPVVNTKRGGTKARVLATNNKPPRKPTCDSWQFTGPLRQAFPRPRKTWPPWESSSKRWPKQACY